MGIRVSIEVSDAAFKLAEKMMADGDCDKLDEAFERSVAIASFHDAEHRTLEADSAAARLAEFAGIGRRREQSGMGVRTWLVDNRWQLLYASTSMPIRSLRVTWAAGDPAAQPR